MNPLIEKYWKDQGKDILLQEEPSNIWKNVPAYYYHMNSNGPKVFVACKYLNGEWAYWLYPNWHSEQEMLDLIK